MIALIQQYRLLLLGLAVTTLMTLSATGAWQWQANAYGKQLADIRTAQAEALATAQAQARAEEQRRQLAIEGIRHDAQTHIAQAATDATAADRTADGLRGELARLKRRPASCPGATAGSEARPDATAVLADLLEEVERAGRAMAAEADRRGIAGGVCERSFDAVKGEGKRAQDGQGGM